MRCFMRRVPLLALLFLVASWTVTAAPVKSPEPSGTGRRLTKESVDKYNNALLGAVGEFLESCDGPAFTNASSELVSLIQGCSVALPPSQGGWGQGICDPGCVAYINKVEDSLPGCERELNIAEALLAKNMTRAFLSNGTLPRGDDAVVLTASVQINQPEIPDDFFTSKEDGTSLFANQTFSRAFVSTMTKFMLSSFAEYYSGCVSFPIQDISESTVLNVTINRTQEEELVLDQYQAKLAKFRSQLLEEFSTWLPEQCRGSEYVAPSYDFLELALKCNNASSNEYFYPSADATCPEECIQFSTISAKELPGCHVAEELLVSQLGYEWAKMYLLEGKLPSDGNPDLMQGSQKLFVHLLNLGSETQYPTDLFDQDDRREEYASNFTRAIGFLQITAKDLSTEFATNYHLGCYRKDPKMSTTTPGEIDQVSSGTSSASLMIQVTTVVLALYLVTLL
ncbi:hypothetical protein M9435_000080 [Picochlorum sp. BPE23]|nr:hypothetical protein M9435_000080 [Picochlorum sp. BPE23]